MTEGWEVLPESQEAIDDYGPFRLGGDDLERRLREVADQARQEVPDLVGISVTLRELEVTFTLVASDHQVAVLDAVQYLDGGPCVAAAEDESPTTSSVGDPLDEARWHLFCAANAAHGVASTLSLPIVEHDVVIGVFNLYAASSSAFDGRHDALADLLGAWAQGAVTHADLSFGTQEVARRAPAILRDRADLSRASALLARSSGIDVERWKERLRLAAARGAVPLADLVATILRTLGEDDA